MQEYHPLRVFIVEEHDLVRQSLSLLMSRRPGFEVVGEAATAAEALEKMAELEVDVAVIDVRLPDQSGIEASREIRARYPQVKILLLTSHGDDRAVINSVLAGAAGYLLKKVQSQEIIEAIRRVARGQLLLDPAFTRRVLERVSSGAVDDEDRGLTEEERRILELITQGKTDQEIAAEAALTETTVRSYISSIHGKLEVTRRTQSVAYSITWRTRLGDG
jgi:two-component system, NarL family, response regulator DevR